MEIVEESRYRFVIARHGRMLVPGVVSATRALLPGLAGDRSLQQVANVAELPGIVEGSYAMPDVHWGTGSRSAGSLRRMSRTAVWSRQAVSGSTFRAASACSPLTGIPVSWPQLRTG